MKCENIVAFGMNSVEFHTVCVIGVTIFIVWLGASLVKYLNKDIGKDRKIQS
jgi:hypothetical protein